MDINLLSKQIFKDKKLRTKENFLSLFKHFSSNIESLTVKEKMHLTPTLNYYLFQAYKAGEYTVDDLKFYIENLKKYHAPSHQLSQVIAKLYVLTGGEPKILATKLGSISVESGTIAVSDISYLPQPFIDSTSFDKSLIDDVNSGKAFYWGTGGDGAFDINLRWIEGQEPSVTPREVRFIIASSSQSIISVPSGVLCITDVGLDADKSPVQLKVDPGNYLVRVHQKDIRDKYFGYVVVVCKTDQAPHNHFTDIEGLG